jgi:hypothetical protein
MAVWGSGLSVVSLPSVPEEGEEGLSYVVQVTWPNREARYMQDIAKDRGISVPALIRECCAKVLGEPVDRDEAKEVLRAV